MVQPGDTLGNIAVKYGTSVQAIVWANGIKNPNMIYTGQILRIPTEHYDDNNNNYNNGNNYHWDNEDNYHKHYKHHYYHND
ncbi:LysM peptidoglycan-binding domain-containing protein (plasmid) [Alicyclobacillus fastidiosus]|uniref:LysM peptidoglycan-binding domain-containing protein n=2 Tax=Alicyclobacillus fastidiosus TaxID=392011 RepID=A0ABY6ZQB4_9BACL|nr:LysM domain-containing protein [Alicyclobacillus fastidiosus]WAH45027.1 LysM peptidoglycan-binding domain-containing protein [Alicyclobacillus fastidiosus]